MITLAAIGTLQVTVVALQRGVLVAKSRVVAPKHIMIIRTIIMIDPFPKRALVLPKLSIFPGQPIRYHRILESLRILHVKGKHYHLKGSFELEYTHAYSSWRCIVPSGLV
jgi:hypothetical protein